MLSHGENRLDFSRMMNEGKIFLAKLSQGMIGSENSFLLGSLLFAKLHQAALSRQRIDENQRRAFFVYADEFQNFICPIMTEILSGARKYRMGLILAHQEVRQLDRNKNKIGIQALEEIFLDCIQQNLTDTGKIFAQIQKAKNASSAKSVGKMHGERRERVKNETVVMNERPW